MVAGLQGAFPGGGSAGRKLRGPSLEGACLSWPSTEVSPDQRGWRDPAPPALPAGCFLSAHGWVQDRHGPQEAAAGAGAAALAGHGSPGRAHAHAQHTRSGRTRELAALPQHT